MNTKTLTWWILALAVIYACVFSGDARRRRKKKKKKPTDINVIPQRPDYKPVFAIVTIGSRKSKYSYQMILETYPNFITKYGGRVVFLDSEATEEQQMEVIKKTAGAFLVGANSPGNGYAKTLKLLVNYAKETGTYTLVGICWGLQRILQHMSGSKRNLITRNYAKDIQIPVKWRDSHENSSRINTYVKKAYRDKAETIGMTFHNHMHGITVDNFESAEGLTKNFRIVATSNSTRAPWTEFVTVVEHRELPIYLFQHHPESLKFGLWNLLDYYATKLNEPWAQYIIYQAANISKTRTTDEELERWSFKHADLFYEFNYNFFRLTVPPNQRKNRKVIKQVKRSRHYYNKIKKEMIEYSMPLELPDTVYTR